MFKERVRSKKYLRKQGERALNYRISKATNKVTNLVKSKVSNWYIKEVINKVN